MADKVKFSITSDGTSKGTKIVLNGETISETKKIVSCNFYGDAATAYPSYEGKMNQYPETIRFGYTAVDKNDKGETTYTQYNFNLAKDKWEPTITPLGQPIVVEPTMEDSLNVFGSDSKLINEILSFKDNEKLYVPSRDELINRTTQSLNDLLTDLKKEI